MSYLILRRALEQAAEFEKAMSESEASSVFSNKADNTIEGVCPYCGNKTPSSFKIYQHPKDKDCVGIYGCSSCGKKFVRQSEIHAEVW